MLPSRRKAELQISMRQPSLGWGGTNGPTGGAL